MHWYKQPEWWLCILGVVTLPVVIWQSWVATKSAAAAQKAAEAALLQAKHLEKTERAWLLVNYIDKTGESPKVGAALAMRWTIKNVGKSPAVVLQTKARFQIFECDLHNQVDVDLATTPDYGTPIEVNERLLAPEDSMGFFVNWEHQIKGSFFEYKFPGASKKIWIINAYGYVKYRDVFGEIHESRSCDFTMLSLSGEFTMSFIPYPRAPAAYNQCT